MVYHYILFLMNYKLSPDVDRFSRQYLQDGCTMVSNKMRTKIYQWLRNSSSWCILIEYQYPFVGENVRICKPESLSKCVINVPLVDK